MDLERIPGRTIGPPFPVYPGLVDALARAHAEGAAERDPVAAHVLAACAGYAYADAETFAMVASRLGLEAQAHVRISQAVDAMFVASTAFLVQSRCGRVVILAYRGTEPQNLGNWLGDADVGSESSLLPVREGLPQPRVHAGFHLNVRATWWGVLEELTRAVQGRSLFDPAQQVENPLEALYVTGHSLGGAMALLFALALAGGGKHRAIAERLRAVYTYGQPMAVCAPLPRWVDEVGSRVFRHVRARDPIPALPPAQWGPFVHVGQEFRFQDGGWYRSPAPVQPLEGTREVARSMLALLAPERRRRSFRYSIDEHRPHHYVAELRPRDRVSELGD
ncbi:MAG TPA: lipase family protein [Anaeromyxobacter sp.]